MWCCPRASEQGPLLRCTSSRATSPSWPSFLSPLKMTLLMSAPRRVTCVCLQPWPLVRPHTAVPGTRCFLTNTWRVPESGPTTLCLKDRQKAAPGCRRPSGSTRRAALPPRPLAADTARYWPPAGSRVSSQCESLFLSRIHPQSPWSKSQL